MMNTDNRLLTRESSEHIREFFSLHRRTSLRFHGASLCRQVTGDGGRELLYGPRTG